MDWLTIVKAEVIAKQIAAFKNGWYTDGFFPTPEQVAEFKKRLKEELEDDAE